jgi:hypothetical protein
MERLEWKIMRKMMTRISRKGGQDSAGLKVFEAA